jgi:lipopolysaccharide heptosyltransferase I
MGWTPLRDFEARRIVIIKPSALGDIIHSLPVLTALRHRYPRARITWVVNRTYEPLLRCHPDLDATMPLDRSAMHRGWMATWQTYRRFIHDLRRQRFDLLIDLQGLLRSGLMSGVSKATRRVGLSTAREGAGRFYTDIVRVPEPNKLHAVDRYWVVAERFGVGHLPKQFRLEIPDQADDWALDLLSDHPRPWLTIGVGARWLTKRWPPAQFAELTRRAQERFGGTALFVGGPDETSLARQTAADLHGPVHILTGKTTLPQLAALLSHTDMMIANDTGPLHLAAALGRPVVAPYTCTRVSLTGPYGAADHCVEAPIWCQGSRFKRCNRLECMDVLTPDLLWPHVQEILGQWQSHSLSA